MKKTLNRSTFSSKRPVRIAINGFGRIGRATFRYLLDQPRAEVVAINDLTDPETLAYLLRFDTLFGRSAEEISSDSNGLIIRGIRVPITAEKDPAALPWKKMKVDVVIESTGRFTDPKDAKKHLLAGAARVIISAPAKGPGAPTFVLGVNDEKYSNESIINNASCTTNCIAPIAAIVDEAVGISKAMMTTIHSYTADQLLVDGPHRDHRRGRAAAQNIVPTSTGAATATAEALPKLKDKFSGLSLRVPTPLVSLSDMTILTKRSTSIQEINRAFIHASKEKRFEGIVSVTDQPVVSSDFIGDTHSAIVDLSLTDVVDGNLLKVIAWYDNESGYSLRLAEQAILVGLTV